MFASSRAQRPLPVKWCDSAIGLAREVLDDSLANVLRLHLIQFGAGRYALHLETGQVIDWGLAGNGLESSHQAAQILRLDPARSS